MFQFLDEGKILKTDVGQIEGIQKYYSFRHFPNFPLGEQIKHLLAIKRLYSPFQNSK